MEDHVETRELRYFVALAEEMHFGRAAQRLGIAQPPLSRAIQQLERRLGVTLVDRTSRTLELTAAGEVLLHEGRAALDAVATAARRTRRAGLAEPRLILVMKPGADGGLLPDILAEYGSVPGAAKVDIVFSVRERAAMLRDGRADVGLLRRPQNDLSGLDAEDLVTERQVVVLPEGHTLARRASVCLADLDHQPTPRWPGPGDADREGPLIHDIGQLTQLIQVGRLIAVAPESVRDRLPSSLVCLPVTDAPSATIVVAWPQHSRSRQVAAFVQAAVAVAQGRQRRAS
jgi:DNA-binding transcriptional LysR family regulator